MSFARQHGRDLVIVHLGAGELEHSLPHLLTSAEICYGADAPFDVDLCDRSATPNDPHQAVNVVRRLRTVAKG